MPYIQKSQKIHGRKIILKHLNGLTSPDLNPIENLWAIVKKRPRKHNCTTKTELTTAILQTWFENPEIQNICKNMVDSMPNRVQKVIAALGGHTKY